MFSLKKIKFKPIVKSNLKLVLSWRNSKFIRLRMLDQKIISFKNHLQWFENLKKDNKNKSYLIIYDKIRIGVANISKIDNINKVCTWGFYIAIKKYRYLALLIEIKFIDFIFSKFKIRKIWGSTISSNKKILKIHDILGFKIEGVQRKQIKVNNCYKDIILTGLNINEWKKIKKKILKKYDHN